MQVQEISSSPQARQALNIVDVQNQTKMEMILDRLETQICDYIIVQSQNSNELSLNQIRGLFLTYKKVVRR